MPSDDAGAGVTRARFLRTATLGGAGVTGAAFVLASRPDPAVSAASARQDAEILNFVLVLERLQAAFYADAYHRAKITGELRELARVVGAHERAHVAFIEKALGSAAKPAPRFAFGAATQSAAAFLDAGRKLEDLGVQAYNGQAANLTKAALGAAAKIVSVEGRHAAWIRDLAGVNPAPSPTEPTKSAEQVQAALRSTGFIK